MNPIMPLFVFAMATWGSNGPELSGPPAATVSEVGDYVRMQSELPVAGAPDELLQLAQDGRVARTPSVRASVPGASQGQHDHGGSR